MELPDTNQQQNQIKSSKYVRDFETLFVPIKSQQLRDKARSGSLRHCQFRSLCWRYFLHCLPDQYDQWLISCSESRANYQLITAKHLESKRALSIDDQQQNSPSPTSTITTNPSASSNQDNELLSNKHDNEAERFPDSGNKDKTGDEARKKELEEEQQYNKAASKCDHKNVLKTIERDVVRTFPDMEFFRQTDMQAILERVLFHYASENSHLSYKQGMHELLATLLYVLHTDSQNCLINYQGGYANDTIASLLDLKYLEHDTYQLFSALMKSLETWYQNDEILTSNSKTTSSALTSHQRQESHHRSGHNNNPSRYTSAGSSSSNRQVTSVLGSKLKLISENIVRNYDLELFNHLEALQITPQIYGIRWMRLLFGREFEFLDLLTVWDAIICDKVTMSLTNYIFASMLITIREELVNGDYTDCLNNLMRHQFKDVQYVIKLALYLRNPKKHNRPKALYSQVKKNFSQFLQHNQPLQHNRKSKPGETSLTSRLSQQYISVKQQIQQANSRYEQWSNSSSSSHATANRMARNNRQQHPHQSQQLKQQSTLLNQQYHNSKLSATNHVLQPLEKPIKEYEMREMQTCSTSSSSPRSSTRKDKLNLASIYGKGSSGNLVNISSESYEDLHSIVDYCWRLLSEQIDSLQRCLPKEKSLHSEDEIFVALAQLKKVRDVLKGSLRLEDELESTSHADERK